jgi:transposase
MKQRKGAKKAIIALAHKLLVIIYTMLKTGSPFNEQCFETRKALSQRKRVSKLIHELAQLGYEVKTISVQ